VRILLEATAGERLGRDRGIGRYLAAITDANAALGNDVRTITVPVRESRTGEFLALGSRCAAVARRDYDVFHAPTAYYSAIDVRRRASVVSILDVIPLDLEAHRQTGLKAKVFHAMAARADAVLTLSEHASRRISELLHVAPERIVVAPLPVAEVFLPDGAAFEFANRPYVAMLMDLRTPDPRKRAHWLPRIASELDRRGVGLVVAGGGTETLDLAGVRGLGRVPDEVWANVLRGAAALVYTSSYEGQGMPPLEAIACGTPAIAMANTAIPEVVGQAGVLVPEAPDEVDAIQALVDAACAIAHGGDSSIWRARCRAQAAQFTPQRFTRGLDRAYTLALGAA